ncbi:MAG TPA: aminotransferase class V-fold PLP-dependent enzyme [Acidimicrobiia bacterium]|jgi:aromatic-L-amino-acid decarboxylase|nr:aminotransferase class V-fold PLP-dependent enzyme [Acidimicrobiia bacterium]
MAHALEPDRELRTELTETVLAYLNDWYDAAEHMDGQGVELDAETLASFRAPPGETGRPLESILADLTLAGRDGHMHPSGGHMSYIPNSGMYTAALAEFLAAGLNRYTGVASAAPGFSAIEHGVVDWLRSIFDLGPESSGLLLSGGSMANFTGVVTARNAMLGDDFSDGVMYVTRHTHHSAAKAARLAGFRSDQVVTVDVDERLRMSPEALRERVESDRAAGRSPFLVVASAGTTDTGTIDPLDAVADVAASRDLWLHVDAAYGGFFELTTRGHAALTGIGGADSIALDPHKGLSIPFGVGALIARRESDLVEAHLGRGAYLRDDDFYNGIRDIASLGPELSRPFRALSVWLPLQLHGVAPFREALDASLDLAEYAYDRLQGVPGIETSWKPDLSIVAFRFEDDEAGRAAWTAVNQDRKVHLSPTIIEGRFVLRFAILNRRSTKGHVDHAIEIIEKTLAG